MAIFCLFFIAISGVSASDALDMSNNPDNSNILSDSIDSESEESVGNSYTDQLSVTQRAVYSTDTDLSGTYRATCVRHMEIHLRGIRGSAWGRRPYDNRYIR